MVNVGRAKRSDATAYVIADWQGNVYVSDSTFGALYRWDGDTLVISAPTPGAPRPSDFEKDPKTRAEFLDLMRVRKDSYA